MSYRIGIVGTGDTPDDPDTDGYAMAYRHAAGYERQDDCELVACADIVRENAERFAAAHGIADDRVYESHDAMLANASLDVVSVCVPPAAHAEIVCDCADADLAAVHCEKPMATTWADCRRMGRTCADGGVALTINHQRRLAPVYRRAKRLLDEGHVGDLRRIEWTAKNLYDAGTHMFDLSSMYVDGADTEWVLANVDYRTENRQFGVHNENRAVAEWRYDDGVTARAATGFDDPLGARLRLRGTAGTIEVGATDGPPLRVRTDRSIGWRTVDVGETIWGNRRYVTPTGYVRWALEAARDRLRPRFTGEPFRGYPTHTDRAIASVMRAVRNGDRSPLTWHNAIRGTELIFAAWESARRTERVELPLAIDGNPLAEMVDAGELPVATPDTTA